MTPNSTDHDETRSDLWLPPPQRERAILVSVQDIAEAEIALNSGADIIDFKDPTIGPLGQVDPQVWSDATNLLASGPTGTCSTAQSSRSAAKSQQQPLLSAALGEGVAGADTANQLPAEFAFAKIGTSGITSAKQLRELWKRTRANLPTGTELVAVAYADFAAAQTLPPEQIFSLAATFGLGRCLLDTFTKDGISSVTHLTVAGLQSLDAIAESRDLWWALGGSITTGDLQSLADVDVRPPCFAVRGDVCTGGRAGTLDPSRVESWVLQVRRFPSRYRLNDPAGPSGPDSGGPQD